MKLWRGLAWWGFLSLTLFSPAQAGELNPLRDPAYFSYGINYYPQRHLWELMWTQYDVKTIERDLTRVSNIGFNTVRIFLHFETFTAPLTIKPSYRNLHHFLDTAARKNLRVVVTLFDWSQPYPAALKPQMLAHLKEVVRTFSQHPALLAWDLKNEPDLDYRFYDTPNVVDAWIQNFSHSLKMQPAASSVPLTVGWLHPSQTSATYAHLDFLSFHHYEVAENIGPRMLSLRQKLPGLPIILGEVGLSVPPAKANGNSQKDFLLQSLRQAIEFKAKGIWFWTLYDFPPNRGRERPEAENYFGLFSATENPKPVVAYLSKPCVFYYPTAHQLRDRVPFFRKQLTVCLRTTAPTKATLSLTSLDGNVFATLSAELSDAGAQCVDFAMPFFWQSFTGKGYGVELSAPSLASLGGENSQRRCKISVDEYFSEMSPAAKQPGNHH